jgi:hypothetical protein
MVPVPVPTFEKLWFRFRFRFLLLVILVPMRSFWYRFGHSGTETPLQELTTPDGTSVWAGDGVHLTSPAYRVAVRLLTAKLERSAPGETGEPATKRPRLESVVPAAAPPPAKPVFKAPPPTPKPVAPPLWLSGQLPASNKYHNNRDSGYNRDYGGGRGVGGGRGGRGRGRGRGGSRGKN